MSHSHSAGPWWRRTAVALLELDRATESRTDQEIAAEVEQNYRWNLGANLLDGAAFWFGLSFLSASTIAPLFVSKLTTSTLYIGLTAVIANGGWFLPQIFTARWTEGLPRVKPVAVKLGLFIERLPIWLLVVSAVVATYSPGAALAIFFVGYALRGLGAGAVGPAWQELVARWCPVERRGRFMGLANFLGAGAGAAGSVLTTWLLDAREFPDSFVIIFAIAAGAMTLSWVFLSLTREPAHPQVEHRPTSREFRAGLPEILRRDHNFRRFLVARSLMALGNLGLGFITVAAVRRWQVPDSAVGLYTAAYWLGQTAGTLSLGVLADRRGHKLSLEIGALAAVSAYALAWLAPVPDWYYAVFFLIGINSGAVLGSGILIALEFSQPGRRPTYAGLTNTAVGLVNITAPLVGTLLAGASYSWTSAASAVVSLFALTLMHWWVLEPRWHNGATSP
jgi:MFS family permease